MFLYTCKPWNDLFSICTPLKDPEFLGMSVITYSDSYPQVVSSVPTRQVLNKYVELDLLTCLYTSFNFMRSRSVVNFSWNTWVSLLPYIVCNYMDERLWGWTRQICKLEKKECASFQENGRGRNQWCGKLSVVKGGKLRNKVTIKHLKIMCHKALVILNCLCSEILYFWITFGKVEI